MSRRVLSIILAVVLLIGVVITVVLSMGGGDGSGDSGSGEGPYTGDCTSVTVLSSSEKAALMGKAAEQFNTTNTKVNNKCVHVTVNTMASGAAETALARGWNTATDGAGPTVWAPASSTWEKLLAADEKKADKPSVVKTGAGFEPVSIVKTPLVLAMPEPAARALGWPDKPIGWKTIADLAGNPAGWASAGHPEWGKFTLGKTSPDLSTSGLAATVGAFVAATGKSSDLTANDLKNPQVLKTVTEVENSAVHYGDTTLTFLSNLLAADDKGKGMTYVSAVAVEEKSVYDYNTGNPSGALDKIGQHAPPKIKLVAVYPSEGTLYSDNPYIILSAPWVSAEQADGAVAFRNFLLGSEAQQIFTDAGFRTAEGKAGAALAGAEYKQTVPVAALTSPSGQTLADVRNVWRDIRKKANVMLVLDVSGSMGDSAGAGTKLEEARGAASAALKQLGKNDNVGLAIFTSDLPGGDTYEVLVPVGPASKTTPQIQSALSSLEPLNGTPLYSATRKAATQIRDSASGDKINAVVILTDGKNEDDDTDLARLLTDLETISASEGGSPAVRVFTIAYGADADFDTLSQISAATGAKAYDARKPGTINDIFTTVISNF